MRVFSETQSSFTIWPKEAQDKNSGGVRVAASWWKVQWLFLLMVLGTLTGVRGKEYESVVITFMIFSCRAKNWKRPARPSSHQRNCRSLSDCRSKDHDTPRWIYWDSISRGAKGDPVPNLRGLCPCKSSTEQVDHPSFPKASQSP